MPLIYIDRDDADQERMLRRADLPGVLRVERAEIIFDCEYTLPHGSFPGPALRGLLGRMIGGLHGDLCQDFLQNRFKGERVSWRFAFSEPPEENRFAVQVLAMGDHAREDLCVILSALSLPKMMLRLPGFKTHLQIFRAQRLKGFTLEYVETEPYDDELGSASCSPQLQLLTPACIHHQRLPWLADDWVVADTLLDSIALRFADLSGMMRRSIAKPQTGCSISSDLLMDVQIPMPMGGRHQMTAGVLGTVGFSELDRYSLSLLQVAEIIGLGRSTAFGLGSVALI